MEKVLDERFWAGVREKEIYNDLINRLLDDYRATKKDATVSLPSELRHIFTETGSRLEFERPYFRKRRLTVSCALLAMIYPEEEEYLQVLHQSLGSTCDEISWALPAHCIDATDESTVVDLFASETACMLAGIVVLLKNRLRAETRDRVVREIQRRVFDPYCRNEYWWESGRNNWTAVCCGCVGVAMMRLDPERFERVKERILNAMALYIRSFPDDGNCAEGLGYWHYGFGIWVWFSDTLYAYTDKAVDLFKDEKVKKIASYAQKVLLRGNTNVSVSDSARNSKLDRALMLFLHGKYPDACSVLPKEKTQAIWPNIAWLQITNEFVYGVGDQAVDFCDRDHYFEVSGQAIVNKEKYSLFVKAGNNGESHNHNDIGSFILSTKQCGQIFCDLGAGRYFRGYFDPEIRYTVVNNASWGHSVPIVDGAFQNEGEAHAGTLSWNGNVISVEFASAYDVDRLKLNRSFNYDTDRVEMTDEISGCGEIVERFVSVIEPKVLMDAVEIGNVKLFSKNKTPKITESTFENNDAIEEKVYFIDYLFGEKEKINFEMVIS